VSVVRAVLFDIGDTLWGLDPLPGDLEERMANALRGESGLSMDEAAAVVSSALGAARAIAANDLHHEPDLAAEVLLAARAAGHPLSTSAAAAAAHALGAADIERLVPNPQAADVLGQLAVLGLRIGVLSNTWTAASVLAGFVERQGAMRHLHAATFSSAEGIRKPSPELYRRALSRLGADPGETLFVGDRVREDVIGPQRAGMRAALTHQYRQEAPGAAQPLAILSDLRDVLGLVAALNNSSAG
jgi:putative hydrolase of the HAD superfamily